MKIRFPPLLLLWLLLVSGNSSGQNTFYLPVGNRSMAMGNTGYALADDEMSIYHNPAGLGLRNYRWNGGAACYSNSSIYSVPNHFYGISYQNDKLPGFGFAGYWDQIDYGTYDEILEDASGNPLSTGTTWSFYEFTVSANAGYNFYSNKLIDNSAGIAIKYFCNATGSNAGHTDVNAWAVAADLGYIFQILGRFRCGLAVRNIGPDVVETYKDTSTGTSHSAWKLPLTIGLGIGYKDSFTCGKIGVLDIAAEISLDKIFNQYYRHPSPLFVNSFNTGVEFCLLKTVSIRGGYSADFVEIAESVSLGLGLSLFNHFDFDLFLNHNDFKLPASAGGSISVKRLLTWSRKDLKWWREEW